MPASHSFLFVAIHRYSASLDGYARAKNGDYSGNKTMPSSGCKLMAMVVFAVKIVRFILLRVAVSGEIGRI